MKIIPNQEFKHDGKVYEAGKDYDVDENLAFYFNAAGWVGQRAGGQDATLNIQDMQVGHKSEVN